jgi:RHS repeat-associated protein
VLNKAYQRTQQTFKDGNYVDYTYDDIGQLLTAKGKEAGGTTRLQEQFSYGYDAAWNLNKRTNNALIQAFNVNNLNQLTMATNSGTLTVAGNTTATATSVTVNSLAATLYADNTFAKAGFTVTNGNNVYTAIAQDSLSRKDTNSITFSLSTSNNYAYDSNGNLLYDGNRAFVYDDENQLTRVTVTNKWKSEFSYDGFMRQRIRKEFTWSGSWVQTNEMRYLYDGRVVLQERDANNLAMVSYTRGIDLSGSRQGAGGIGGLLARTDHGSQLTAYYHSDGNGNVTTMINTQQIIVARYNYDPYGNNLSKSGPLAEANSYRFSGKEYHANSGLVYYLYRFYDPNLQRWLNRDPIEESGGLNLYSLSRNEPVNSIDPFGLMDFYPPGLENKIYPDDFVGPLPPGCYRNSEAQAMANRNGLQPSLLGELLIPSGVGALARTPSALKCIPKAAAVRTEARNLAEQLALKEAKAGAGNRIMQGAIKDSKFPEDVWAKMQHTHGNTTIHYWKNLKTGERTGFKFKDPDL